MCRVNFFCHPSNNRQLRVTENQIVWVFSWVNQYIIKQNYNIVVVLPLKKQLFRIEN